MPYQHVAALRVSFVATAKKHMCTNPSSSCTNLGNAHIATLQRLRKPSEPPVVKRCGAQNTGVERERGLESSSLLHGAV